MKIYFCSILNSGTMNKGKYVYAQIVEFLPQWFFDNLVMKYNGNKFTRRFDANSYLYITKAMDYFDLTEPHGSLAAAFANSTSLRYLVVSFTSDWLYPSYHSKELVRALTAAGADVTYLDIQSTWGHDAFLLEVDTMTRLLGSFLDRLVREEGVRGPEIGGRESEIRERRREAV